MEKTTVLPLTALLLIVILLSGCLTREKVAEFEVSVLSVSQASLTVGESTTVEVTVENLGETRTSHEVKLKVDGEIHESKEITLDPAETTVVTFTLSFEKEGNYEVSVGNKKSVISVTAAEPATPAALLQMATDFLLLLENEDYATAVEQFDETVRNALPAEKLREVWKNIIANFGVIHSLGEGKVSEKEGFQIVLIRVDFEKGSLNARLSFDHNGRIAGLFFAPADPVSEAYTPPNYVNKKAFLEREVLFGAQGWELPGTLSLPEGEGPFPVLLLVHGSGPQDRNQSIGPNKPFKDLAWGLASNGIAVLRYDKRTRVHGEKMAAAGTVVTVEEEVIEDALLALNFLRKQEGIDPERVFLLGHSLGGMLVPEIGNCDGKVAGVIILAGPTRSFLDIILEQFEYIFMLDGKISAAETEKLEETKKSVESIKNREFAEDAITLLGAQAGYWYDLLERNHIEEALRLSSPLLILQGGRDYQVTVEDFEGWQEELAAKENVLFKLYPDLNHLFMVGEGKSTPSEYSIPGNVEEQVIKDIADWIRSIGT